MRVCTCGPGPLSSSGSSNQKSPHPGTRPRRVVSTATRARRVPAEHKIIGKARGRQQPQPPPAGCRTSAATSRRRSRAGCRSWSASTGSASSTPSCRTRPPTTFAGPPVPAESPTLGLGHLQFEALITTARQSTNPNDFALIALLGLLGLRIFEACGASIADLGEEHGHRVLRVRGKGGKVVLVPLPPAVARAIDRAVDDRDQRTDPAQHPRHTDGPARRDPPAQASGRDGRHPDAEDASAHAAPHVRHHHARRRRQPPRRADRRPARRPRTTMRYDRARKNLDRHPNYILAAYMASGT